MKSLTRFLSLLLILLLLMPTVQAESLQEQLANFTGHEPEYMQRFSGHIVTDNDSQSILHAYTGIWNPNGYPDRKGAALGVYVALWDRDLIRHYNLHFSDDGILDSLHVVDYIDSSFYTTDYAPAETLDLADEASRAEAARNGLDAYLNKLFSNAAEEYASIEVERVYTEPFYVMENGEMKTVPAGHVTFSLTIKKDCDWAKASQIYGITWNLAYNELSSIWIQP